MKEKPLFTYSLQFSNNMSALRAPDDFMKNHIDECSSVISYNSFSIEITLFSPN